MSATLTYFRQHRWQRRILTSMLALTLGGIAALIALPHVQDYLLLRDLGSNDPPARLAAISRAIAVAAESPRTLRRLNDALDSAGDVRFAAIVTVLRRLGRFHTPQRDPLQIDRMNAIELAGTRWPADPNGAAHARSFFLAETILCGRDNAYVRRALRAAAADESPKVRELAPVLAARLRDDQALRSLLADRDGAVAGAAALDCALAGRADLGDAIRPLLDGNDPEAVSGGACALALLKPKEVSARLCELLKAGKDENLRDRLLHVMTLLNDDSARQAVRGVLEAAGNAREFPPAMAVLAAGKLGLTDAGPHVKAILTDAARTGTKLTESHALAALDAAGRLQLPVRREVFDLCSRRWEPRLTLTMIAAAELLGRQAQVPQPQEPNSPTVEDCVRLLRAAATYNRPPETQPASAPMLTLTMPLPSAAAAVALWELNPASTDLNPSPRTASRRGPMLWEVDFTSSAFYVRHVAGCESDLAGDYIAFHLARTGRKEAFELASAMLPPPIDPNLPLDRQPPRVHNDSERATGAMLLALSARTPGQKALAVERIRSRLSGGVFGGKEDFAVRSAYRCALVILGEKDLQADVRELLTLLEFPRRPMTAMLASGDESALDWLLWNWQNTPQDVDYLLTVIGIAEALAETAPQLPAVDVAAPDAIRLWQERILRDSYAIHRQEVRTGLRW